MLYRRLVRYLAQVVVALGANAVALLVAAIVLRRFTISDLTFPIVVIIFTGIWLLARPVVRALLKEYASAATSIVGLPLAFVTLLVTDLVSDGLDVEGIGTWVIASIIVWVGGLAFELAFGEAITKRITGRSGDGARS
jgi:hypothetical protein